jgi:hypothetical protein
MDTLQSLQLSQALSHTAIRINMDSSSEFINVSYRLLVFECNMFYSNLEGKDFAVFTKLFDGGVINLLATQITKVECYGPVTLVMLRLQKDEFVPTNDGLSDFNGLLDQIKATQLSSLLVVTRVMESSLCQQLEDERFVEALERLYLGPKGRVETFYVESNSPDVSFTLMRTDDLPHDPITFNHTFNHKGQLIPDLVPKKITILNLQDFCDRFVSSQEGIIPSQLNLKGKELESCEIVLTQTPFDMNDAFVQLTRLMITIFEQHPALNQCLETTQQCQKFLLQNLDSGDVKNLVGHGIDTFVEKYEKELSRSSRVWIVTKKVKIVFQEPNHILLLSTAFNSCTKGQGLELYEILINIVEAVTGDD